MSRRFGRMTAVVAALVILASAASTPAQTQDGAAAGPWGEECADAEIKNAGPIIFVNGILTSYDQAQAAAKQTAKAVKHPVHF